MAKTAEKTVLTKEEVENLTSLQQQQNDLILIWVKLNIN